MAQDEDTAMMVGAVRMEIRQIRDEARAVVRDLRALLTRANVAGDKGEQARDTLTRAIEGVEDFDVELGDVSIGPDDV